MIVPPDHVRESPGYKAVLAALEAAQRGLPRPPPPAPPAVTVAVLRRARSCWFSEKSPGCCSGYTCHLRKTWVDPAHDCSRCEQLPP